MIFKNGRVQKENVNVWLINTGWSGGAYGIGKRIKLKYTRAMISAAMNNQLAKSNYVKHDVFNLNMPTSCPGVPSEILNPINTWNDKSAYTKTTKKLSKLFHKNFEKTGKEIDEKSRISSNRLNEIVLGGPQKQ